MADSKGAIFEFDNFRLDVNERLFMRDGQPIELSSKAFDLLLALVENSGRLVEKRELYNRVWAGQFVEDSNLTVQMSAIRKALGDGSYIKTVKGHGYRFAADVSERSGLIENGAGRAQANANPLHDGRDAEFELSPATVAKRGNVLLPVAAFTLVVAILAIGVYLWSSTPFVVGKPAAFQIGSIQRLSTNGKVANTVLSPDGKLFAYGLQEQDGRYSLRLGHVEGSRETVLIEPVDAIFAGLSFAADSSTLYFTQSTGPSSLPSLYKLSVLGGPPEKLSINVSQYFALSLDSRQIAFFKNDKTGSRSSLYVVDINGENERELAVRPLTLPFISTSLAWSPDGKSIAAAAVTREDGERQDVFVVSTADGTAKQLTTDSWRRLRSLTWLNDQEGLIAVGAYKGSLFGMKLWRISNPTGIVEQLGKDLNIYGGVLSISADGRSLLNVQAHNQSNVWLAEVDNLRDAKQITFDTLGKFAGWSAVEWTPDGRIVYTAAENDTETLWIMDADGGSRKQLLPSDYTNSYPSITGDGKRLIFQSDKSGSSEVWLSGLDGGDLRQVTTGGGNSQPHVSADGKWIVYLSRRTGASALMKIGVDGGEPIRLAENAQFSPRVSTDGKWVAYGYGSDEQLKLAVISIDGGSAVKVFDTPRLANFNIGIRWLPDGKFIAYRDWANGLWRQNIDGGQPERIAGLPEEKLYAYNWSRDGKRFAFTRGQEIRDVVLLRK